MATYSRLWGGASTYASPAPQQALATLEPTAHVLPAAAVEAPRVPSYLGWAAALTVICWPACWAGIAALVYAGRVEAQLAAGDGLGAAQASHRAKTWCWVTFVAGAALWVTALTLLVTL